jgi:AraC-like DNA-binding protein
MKLFIKNMVCHRCILTVQQVLKKSNIGFDNVSLGEVDITKKLTVAERKALEQSLHEVGFEIIESRGSKLIEDIKKAVLKYLSSGAQNVKLSTFIKQKIPYDYSYMSDMFSSVEGKTIEQFFILQRIEKVKELLVYDQLSLTEISYETGFSSVHHLSTQFKKVTGMSPSEFKRVVGTKRKGIDKV